MGVKYGGLDLAKRLDHSAFIVLENRDGILHEFAEKIWEHTDYSIVAHDLERYNKKLRFNKIIFDRTGVGDAVAELFKPQNIYESLVMSNTSKIELINLLQGLMQDSKLKLVIGGELERQIREQEWDISDAGNLLYRHPPNRHDDLFWALCYASYAAAPSLKTIPRPVIRYSQPDYRDLDKIIEDEIEMELSSV